MRLGRGLVALLRACARLVVAFVVYDLVRGIAIGPVGVLILAQVAAGLFAGAVTIIVGKFLYDTFLPHPRTP
jgi:hypothetical protein